MIVQITTSVKNLAPGQAFSAKVPLDLIVTKVEMRGDKRWRYEARTPTWWDRLTGRIKAGAL